MKNKKNIAIIGVGNLLMGDEGVGIHAIKAIGKEKWPNNVEIIDAGVPGASLLHWIENRDLTIIIDCADFKGKPGDVIVVDVDKLKKPDEEIISLHGTSLLGTLKLAEISGTKTGKIILIAVQPQEIKMSDKLSEKVKSALPKIIEIVRKLSN